MLRRMKFCVAIAWVLCTSALAGAAEAPPSPFPPALDSYQDRPLSLGAKLRHRATAEPLNIVATIIFGLAIIHTFLAPKIMRVAHRWRDEHRERMHKRGPEGRREDAV